MALRTNSKQARAAVRQYIIDAYNLEMLDNNQTETSDIKIAAQYYYNDFMAWIYPGAIRGRSYQDAFFKYQSGMPGHIGDFFGFRRSAINTLGDILQQTETERNKYLNQDAERILSGLIYAEIIKAVY